MITTRLMILGLKRRNAGLLKKLTVNLRMSKIRRALKNAGQILNHLFMLKEILR